MTYIFVQYIQINATVHKELFAARQAGARKGAEGSIVNYHYTIAGTLLVNYAV